MFFVPETVSEFRTYPETSSHFLARSDAESGKVFWALSFLHFFVYRTPGTQLKDWAIKKKVKWHEKCAALGLHPESEIYWPGKAQGKA